MSKLFSIARKNESGAIIWSQDQIEYIISEYNKKHSVPQIARDFKVAPSTIRSLLRKKGIKILSLSELKKIDFPRDEKFFRLIDTAEKAYWLGFLYADGYIDKKNSIRVNLKREDENHCQKFLDAIGATNHKLIYSEKRVGEKTFYQACAAIRDNQMVKDLANLGCVNKKSLILQFPSEEQVPSTLTSHFIRGYFDGDGSLHFTQCGHAKKPNYRISFVGTQSFLIKLQEFLGVSHLALENCGNYFKLTISGNIQVGTILEYIYKDSSEEIELRRKRIIYENYKLQRIGG